MSHRWKPRKLNCEKAKRIRALYATDLYTQDELAKMFEVSRITINRVLNHHIYPEPYFHTSGSAPAHLILPYQAQPKEIHAH